MICEWQDTCQQQAFYIVIFGCENQHINEHCFCLNHTIEWEDNLKDHHIHCDCGKHLIEYLIDLTQNLNTQAQQQQHNRIQQNHQ